MGEDIDGSPCESQHPMRGARSGNFRPPKRRSPIAHDSGLLARLPTEQVEYHALAKGVLSIVVDEDFIRRRPLS